jgi:glutathione synthase/RimK-type ligase-like ATP-grasp enzyme
MKTMLHRTRRFLQEDFSVYLRARGKKGFWLQLQELTELYRLYHYPPYQYFKHGLYLESFDGNFRNFLPPEWIHRFRNSINPKQYRLAVIDKKKFTDKMSKSGFVVPQNLAYISRSRDILNMNGVKVSLKELLSWLLETGNTQTFFKPTTGGGGRGVFKALATEEHFLINKKAINETALFNLLFANNRYMNYLVQPFLIQHSLLNSINPAAVNTIRIDTFVNEDETVHNGAALKIGSGTSWADNWAAGGFICQIHLETGELGAQATSKAKYGRHIVLRHPITGFEFSGVRLPFWEETKQLVKAAASLFLPLRALGWDVAITEQGPVIIEANHDYDIFLLQEAAHGLRDTLIGQETLAMLLQL